jgi:hypothetical protein
MSDLVTSSPRHAVTVRELHSSHLHMPDQMLIDPVIRVVHELLLRLLQLVQEEH